MSKTYRVIEKYRFGLPGGDLELVLPSIDHDPVIRAFAGDPREPGFAVWIEQDADRVTIEPAKTSPTARRVRLRILETGEPIPPDFRWVSTVVTHADAFHLVANGLPA